MPGPWLSVVVPTYRGERYLATALASIEAQADEGVECLVVDDGSPDRTRAIARSFESRLDLRLLEGAKRGNWVASTNLALHAARGEHACFLHQDDFWLPGRLRAIRGALRSPSVRLVLHDTRFVDSSDQALGTWRCPLPEGPIEPGGLIERLLVQNFVGIPAPTFRTADALALGGLDEALWYTADWDFWLRLARLGTTHHLAQPLASFRVHGESQTIRRSDDAAGFRLQMSTVLERHLDAVDASMRRETERAARLSIEVNVALAALSHGLRPELGALAASLPADPRTLHRYLRDSRILSRLSARVVARARGRLTS